MPDKSNAMDHVIVVMFENRSFDNLLGRLYEPGEVPSFEGVIGKDLSNPVPGWLDIGEEPIRYTVATDMNTPSPDPGEEFHHINTQLFDLLDDANRGLNDAQSTYNTPPAGREPSMDGFVTDYASMLTFENGRPPTRDEVAEIMTGYTPEQIPVLSGLARGFATFDHWFCDVPSCTFPNRSFFHAGTSSGFVTNFPASKFPENNKAETLFDRLDAAGLTWRVYCDPPCHASLTGIIHAASLRPKFATNFMSTDQFFIDCETGNLPTYTFIEPQVIGWGHNDMHPPFTHLFKAVAKDKGLDPGDIFVDPPSSILGGEELLSRIYDAVRSASTEDGSNYLNTTLLVTFDEHGGTYDHVAPPAAVAPDPNAEPGEMGFAFDRSGVRIPTIAISAWIPERTVITEEHRATSLLATMRKRWDLGAPFTERDASARPFDDIFTLTEPRDADSWPDITPLPVPPMDEAMFPLDAPLGLLGQALLGAVAGYGVEFGIDVPELDPSKLTGREAIAAATDILAKLFPLLAES